MRRLLLIAVGAIALVVTYQNCGKAGFEETSIVDSASTSSTSVDPKLASMPFPYEVSVNQIAHMSCAINNIPLPSSPYFSWKVAAFENPSDVPTAVMNIRESGLKPKADFVSYYNNQVAGRTTAAKAEYLKKALKTHPLVGAAQLQISFRDTNNTRTKLMQMPSGGNSPTSVFMPVLSHDGIVDKVMSDLTKTNDFFPGVPEHDKRSLEGKLTIPSAIGVNNTGLQANYDASYLTVGFQTKPESLDLSGSADTKVYGKGYRVVFSTTNPHQGTTSYPTRDSLVALSEYDLETKTLTSAGWDCSYRFKIVRPDDRYKTFYRANNFSLVGELCPGPSLTGTFCASPVDPRFGISNTFFPNSQCPSNRTYSTGTYCVEKYANICPPEPFKANTSAASAYERTDGLYHPAYPERARIFHALRRVLPTSQWDVNISRGCVVPKVDDNSCYQTSNIVYDEYFSSMVDANADMGRHPGCGVTGLYPCAAYLTLCLRR